ncbi:redox-sensing transcriptional repressor Rex [Selenihalanaerobacter shriftii]|uniref:Redox-sensing transcriptional repressor Rex n=1 Tax=Selenihalanaerobacter shriftii TaxID=142842 RepID=A0A1T4QBF0_9FIRM|nr:redox-sensing transcriptional repressor Rex [Selenihalanaerobacter shriftii]SKA01025.1 redox-sensing transcriptional repressor [Selenihalanaerobacter shriftii]
MKDKTVPDSVIRRLPLYLRVLEELKAKGTEIVSSQQLEDRIGLKATQFRKDLTYFGEFGVRGVGYEVDDLLNRLKKICGLNEEKTAILIGAGHIGTALGNFNQVNNNCKVRIKAIFDKDEDKVGSTIGQIEIQHTDKLPQMIDELDPQIGIIAVPARAAHEITDILIENDMKVLLNFAPVHLDIPDDVYLQGVDLTLELQNLLYYSQNVVE